MESKNDDVLKLIKDMNYSSIELISEKVGAPSEQIVDIINELIDSGELRGHFSDDQSRFFKEDIKISDAPTIPREESEPDFLHYDTFIGKVLVMFGLIIMIIGGFGFFAMNYDILAQKRFSFILLSGLIIMMAGGYQIGSRKTP